MRINDVFSSLRATYIDWRDILVNPNYTKSETEISWRGFSGKNFSIDIIRSSTVAELADDGQYSFQIVEDGSIIQLYYLFDKRGELQKANLAFFYSGAPSEDRFSVVVKSDEEYEYQKNNDISDGELYEYRHYLVGDESPVGWFRIDYGPEEYKGVCHAKCHMHISLFPNSRFAVDGVPNPKQFVEFVVSMCYPHIYKQKRLDDNGVFLDKNKQFSLNEPFFPVDDENIVECLAHFHVPRRTARDVAVSRPKAAIARKENKKRR